MNQPQRAIAACVGALILLMTLFPPFEVRLQEGAVHNAGFAFLASAPETQFALAPSVNLLQLLAQWGAVLIAGGIAFVLAGHRGGTSSGGPGNASIGAGRSTLRAAIMAARIIRAPLGLLGCWQVVGLALGLVSIAAALGQAGDNLGHLIVQMLIKLAVCILCLAGAMALRAAVNAMHRRLHGTPHPALAKWWGL